LRGRAKGSATGEESDKAEKAKKLLIGGCDWIKRCEDGGGGGRKSWGVRVT
jgi:hypothetical protein